MLWIVLRKSSRDSSSFLRYKRVRLTEFCMAEMSTGDVLIDFLICFEFYFLCYSNLPWCFFRFRGLCHCCLFIVSSRNVACDDVLISLLRKIVNFFFIELVMGWVSSYIFLSLDFSTQVLFILLILFVSFPLTRKFLLFWLVIYKENYYWLKN